MSYSDAELEYWGNRFVAEGLRRRLGITFEKFLTQPQLYVEGETPAEQAIENLPRQHGAPIEKLKHRRFPHSQATFRQQPDPAEDGET